MMIRLLTAFTVSILTIAPLSAAAADRGRLSLDPIPPQVSDGSWQRAPLIANSGPRLDAGDPDGSVELMIEPTEDIYSYTTRDPNRGEGRADAFGLRFSSPIKQRNR